MILNPPFFESQGNFEKWISETFSKPKIEIQWYWKPFHTPGLNALKYFSKNNIPLSKIEAVCEELSCPSPPKNLHKKFEDLGLLDSDGRIISLNAEKKIKTTASLLKAGFKGQNLYLPSVKDLNTAVTKLGISMNPELDSLDALKTMSSWLKSCEKLFFKFQNLSPWEKLFFLENTIGMQNSHSFLQFSIYQPNA